MKARDIIGRKIVAVSQQPVVSTAGKAWHIDWLQLDNGRRVWFTVIEDPNGGDYSIEATVGKIRHPIPAGARSQS